MKTIASISLIGCAILITSCTRTLAAETSIHWVKSHFPGCQKLVSGNGHNYGVTLHGQYHIVVTGESCPAKFGKFYTMHATIRSPTEYRLDTGWLCSTVSGWCG